MMKLKKNYVLIILSIILVGCSPPDITDNKNTEVKWYNVTENRTELAREFDRVGINHNKELDNIYQELNFYKNSKRSSKENGLSINEVNKIVDSYYSMKYSRNITEITENEIIEYNSLEDLELTEKVSFYINQFDNIVKNNNSNELIFKKVELLETEAINNLTQEESYILLSYSATMRASLAYWNENLENWDNLLTHEERLLLKSRFVWPWERIKWMATSDALGAAAGAAVGAVIGLRFGGVGAAVGAGIGAAIAGVISSKEGWNTGRLCIIVPLTTIENGIKIKEKW